MPRFTKPVPEQYSDILRPVVLNVVRQIVEITRIKEHDFRISYPGLSDTNQIFNSGHTVVDGNDPKDAVHFEQRGKLSVTVTESDLEETFLTTVVNKEDHYSLFLDKALAVNLRPVYIPKKLVIEFTYRIEDKQAADAWMSRIRTKISQGRGEQPHEVEYEYPLDKTIMYILRHIHALREKQAGYGEDFNTWFMNHVSNRFTLKTDLVGSIGNDTGVFKEEQGGIIGYFEFPPTLPDERKGAMGSLREATFTYTLTYDKPSETTFYYPFVVHNQLLSPGMYDREVGYSYYDMIGDKSYTNANMDFFRMRSNWYNLDYLGIRYPYFDDFRPLDAITNGLTPVYTVLMRVDPNDLHNAFNLIGFKGYKMKEHFIDYLKDQHEFVNKRYQCGLYVQLYKSDAPLSDDLIYVDEELNLKTVRPMDLRCVYHVRLSIINNLILLPTLPQKRLREHPKACYDLLNGLELVSGSKGIRLKTIRDGKEVSRVSFNEALNEIRTTYPGSVNINIPNYNVASIMIKTELKEDKV